MPKIIDFSEVFKENQDNYDYIGNLKELLKKTWNIYALSKLSNFKMDDAVQLKAYAKKLREDISNILPKENVTYSAKITILDIDRPKETDSPVFTIEIFAIRPSEGEDSLFLKRILYKGYYFSWRSEINRPQKKHTRFPLVLCKGTLNTTRAVHKTIQNMFDCLISPLKMNEDDLLWIIGICLTPGSGVNDNKAQSKDEEELSLEYCLPGLPTSDTFTVRFKIRKLFKLWSSILAGDKQITLHHMELFYSIFDEHVFEISGVAIGMCLLNKISFPSITIAGSKMKVTDIKVMNTILTYLSKKAERLFSSV